MAVIANDRKPESDALTTEEIATSLAALAPRDDNRPVIATRLRRGSNPFQSGNEPFRPPKSLSQGDKKRSFKFCPMP